MKQPLKLLALLLALLLCLTACRETPAEEPSSEPSVTPPPASSAPAEPPSSSAPASEWPEAEQMFPVGGIGTSNFIDHERPTYDGTMVLRVPAMDFEGVVLDGTTDAVLQNGVGLFPEGQLPGPENRNVCIAGHRDIHGKEFWDIDKIGEGDLFYLTYQNKLYTYKYVETMLTDPEDWSAVKVREYSAITLQSCDPIYVASHRIFKIGRLVSIEDVEPVAAA